MKRLIMQLSPASCYILPLRSLVTAALCPLMVDGEYSLQI